KTGTQETYDFGGDSTSFAGGRAHKGGFILFGSRYVTGKGGFYQVVSLDPKGKILWETIIKNKNVAYGSLNGFVRAIALLKDGSVLAMGAIEDSPQTQPHTPWFFKLSAQGSLLWEQRPDQGSANTLWAAMELADGSLLLIGDDRRKLWAGTFGSEGNSLCSQ
ncbi:MAG: hypothetical protein HN348_32780, partial [Proteobacteria bacterium]|nr:hypothetical protein [Pseudomonadota bacterium]